MNLPILIVEDEITQSRSLARFFQRRMDFGSLQAENGRIALNTLREDEGVGHIKLVIMDVDMPIMGGMEALKIIRQRYPDLPVIMLTGSNDIKNAVEAMHLGAMDFITKPFDDQRLEVTVRNALKLSVLTREVNRLRNHHEGTLKFSDLIGYDSGLMEAVALGRKAAASDISVLISGETGTGKEMFARAIHGESARAGRPFIAVNCGAIPAQLVESTLFGHEKGSFTGATEKVLGKFREAEGGTVFLDEVGELPMEAQVKLLRVLQEGEVEPVGAGKPVPVNVRILSATNRKLEDLVEKGGFREDLYYRLNVLSIDIPPLRERIEDIVPLANFFTRKYSLDNSGIPKPMSQALEEFLEDQLWPGNVRELENVIHRAMVISEDGVLCIKNVLKEPGRILPVSALEGVLETQYELKQKEIEDRPWKREHPVYQPDYRIRIVSEKGEIKTMREIESLAMEAVLDFYDQNVSSACKALDIAKSTFYRKMKEYFPDFLTGRKRWRG